MPRSPSMHIDPDLLCTKPEIFNNFGHFKRPQVLMVYLLECWSTQLIVLLQSLHSPGFCAWLLTLSGIHKWFNSRALGSWHPHLYADDILLYRTITASSDYVILQNDINTPSNWLSRNNLTLKPSKRKHLVFSKLQKHSVKVPILTLNNEVLEKVSSFKYLGVNITDDLTWSTHISVIARKARKILGLLYRQFST